MKIILLLLVAVVFVGCTQKYETFYVIDKANFNKKNYQPPIAPKLRRTTKAKKYYCENQFFFSSNAKTKTDIYTNNVVNYMCPDSKYLLDTRITDTWWTTIIYTRSCVEIESFCSKNLD
jgi:hypothetical protein